MIFVVCHNKLTSIRLDTIIISVAQSFHCFYDTWLHSMRLISWVKILDPFPISIILWLENGIILVQQKHWNNLNLTIYIMNDFWVDIWKALRQNCLIVCHDVETGSLEEKEIVVILLLRLHLTDSWHFYCKIVYLQ